MGAADDELALEVVVKVVAAAEAVEDEAALVSGWLLKRIIKTNVTP